MTLIEDFHHIVGFFFLPLYIKHQGCWRLNSLSLLCYGNFSLLTLKSDVELISPDRPWTKKSSMFFWKTVWKEKTHGYLLWQHVSWDVGLNKSHCDSETLKSNQAVLTYRTHKRTWVMCLVNQNILQILYLTSTAPWYTQDSL